MHYPDKGTGRLSDLQRILECSRVKLQSKGIDQNLYNRVLVQNVYQSSANVYFSTVFGKLNRKRGLPETTLSAATCRHSTSIAQLRSHLQHKSNRHPDVLEDE